MCKLPSKPLVISSADRVIGTLDRFTVKLPVPITTNHIALAAAMIKVPNTTELIYISINELGYDTYSTKPDYATFVIPVFKGDTDVKYFENITFHQAVIWDKPQSLQEFTVSLKTAGNVSLVPSGEWQIVLSYDPLPR